MKRAATPMRSRMWWPSAATLAVATGALAATLLLPRLFSDPVGLDPYVLRLTAVAAVLGALALVWGRLAAARPILLTLAAMTAAFSVFAGGPQWIVDISGSRFDGNTLVLMASAAEAVITVVVAALALRQSLSGDRPALRWRSWGRAAAVATAAGTAVFLVLVILLPATLLGRLGVAPAALARDLPLAAPADAFQAFAQELQFRGLLLGTLERTMPPWVANLVQALFFGLAHIAVQYQGPAGAFVPVTVLLGFALGWITQRTGSLWPAIIIHGIADIAVSVGVTPGLYGS